MAQEESLNGYWLISENNDFEYYDADTDELLDTIPFAKARSLTAFFMWQVIESMGE